MYLRPHPSRRSASARLLRGRETISYLILRSIAERCVSKDGAGTGVMSILRDGASRLLRMRSEIHSRAPQDGAGDCFTICRDEVPIDLHALRTTHAAA